MSITVAQQLITRAKLSADYRISVAYGGPLAGAYAHARHAVAKGLVLDKQVDAQSAADHACGLYVKMRWFLTVTMPWAAYSYGDVKTIAFPRYGFDGGRPMMIVGIQRDEINRTKRVTFWG